MTRSAIRRLTLAALTVLLVAPWSAAAERRGHPAKRPQVVVASPLANLLGYFLAFWAKEGCGIDPSGGGCLPASSATTTNTDEGCGIDPNGRCTAAILDAGCGIDPDGRCTAATTDAGCGIDPSGCAGGN